MGYIYLIRLKIIKLSILDITRCGLVDKGGWNIYPIYINYC